MVNKQEILNWSRQEIVKHYTDTEIRNLKKQFEKLDKILYKTQAKSMLFSQLVESLESITCKETPILPWNFVNAPVVRVLFYKSQQFMYPEDGLQWQEIIEQKVRDYIMAFERLPEPGTSVTSHYIGEFILDQIDYRDDTVFVSVNIPAMQKEK